MATKLFKISDIFEFSKKSRRKAGDGLTDGLFPFFTSSQIQSKWFNEADYDKESIILGTGGSASVHVADKFSASTDTFILTPTNEKVTVKYVYYYLLGNKHILESGFKGAGLKHISKEYVQKISIPFPVDTKGNLDLKEQQRIVSLIQEAESLKNKRYEANQKMEDLISALFVKMFPSENLPKDKIVNLINDKYSIRTGPFGSQLHHNEFTENGIPVLGIDNVVKNKFRWTYKRCLPEDKFNKFSRFEVYPGDVLVTIMGTVGRVVVAPDNLPRCMSTKHLCVITTDKEKINPLYLWASLLFDSKVRKQTQNVSKGAIMEGWNSTIIKNLLVSLPPIELQNKFADLVKEIEKQKEEQLRSTQMVDELFNSVMTKSFA